MASPIHTMSQSVRSLWSALTGQLHAAHAPAKPEVLVHDPAARRPHDLDDPFFDLKVQARIANVIAHAGQKN
jgi:hypothetical protein